MTYREDVRVSPPNFEKSVLNKFRTNPKKKKKVIMKSLLR